jgi:hypothetical protein
VLLQDNLREEHCLSGLNTVCQPVDVGVLNLPPLGCSWLRRRCSACHQFIYLLIRCKFNFNRNKHQTII